MRSRETTTQIQTWVEDAWNTGAPLFVSDVVAQWGAAADAWVQDPANEQRVGFVLCDRRHAVHRTRVVASMLRTGLAPDATDVLDRIDLLVFDRRWTTKTAPSWVANHRGTHLIRAACDERARRDAGWL